MQCRNRDLKIVRIIIFIVVVVSFVAVISTFFVKKTITRENLANAKMEELVRDYYENDFYHRFVRDHTPESGGEVDLGSIFDKYTPIGFTPVKLRKLLDFSDRNNKNMRKYFEQSEYFCDPNKSYVIIKPLSPFSNKDYDLDIALDCKKTENNIEK